MKKTINKNLIIGVLAGITPIVFCAIVWFCVGIYPGSYRTLLSSDMESQYVSFYESLRSIISGENSIFYNWSLYLGNNYWGHYAYYLASPWSWFLLLWKTEHLPMAIYFMSLIKIGLCGVCFSVFLLNRPVKTYIQCEDEKIKAIAIVAFSTFYALMSYNMMYVISPMWLDSVYLLPLIVCGIERIIVYKKGLLYYVSLSLAIIFNFYTGYMIALFTVLYFVFYVCYYKSNSADNRISFKSCLLYIANSALAVGTSAVILLPTVYCLSQGKLEHNTNWFNTFFTWPLGKLLLRFFDSSYTSVTNEGLPSIFSTSFCILFALFFIVRGLKKQGRISAIVFAVFWIASLWIVPINRIWTGFRDPIWFPYRYAFLISFYFVLLGYEGFITFSQTKINIKFDIKKYIYIFWAVLSVIELFLCINFPRTGIIQEIGAANTTLWNDAFGNFKPLIEKAEVFEASDEASYGFYRIDKDEFFTFNDPMLFSYKGMQSFSSMYNKKPLHFMKHIGLKQDDYELYEKGNTVISDSIIGVKYYITYVGTDLVYESLGNNKLFELYKNPYALSLGYMIEGDDKEIEWSDDVFDNQNRIINSMISEDANMYRYLDYETRSLSYDQVKASITKESTRPTELPYEEAVNYQLDISVETDGHVYLYCAFEKGNRDRVANVYNSFKQYYINGVFFEAIQIGRYSYIMDLGVYNKNDDLSVIITNCSANTGFYVTQMNDDIVEQALGELFNNSGLRNININKGNMTADIDVDKAGLMFMSIPYDEGWTLYIDGKESEIEEIYGTFCAVSLSEGHHDIEMKYLSPYFIEGLVISLASVVVYSLICLIVVWRKKKSANNSNKY
ncbi:MAG: YfhO family protein [Lachnospiraceae bacterium]|nr:YfhO family protein [Lachnospiraceae bacterium]